MKTKKKVTVDKLGLYRDGYGDIIKIITIFKKPNAQHHIAEGHMVPGNNESPAFKNFCNLILSSYTKDGMWSAEGAFESLYDLTEYLNPDEYPELYL